MLLTTTSMSACATSSPDDTKWQGAVRVGSPSRSSTENLACCVSNACPDVSRRGPAVKPVGEPDTGNRYVRFDERGWETGRWPLAPSYRAHPRLYQTARSPLCTSLSAFGGRTDYLPSEPATNDILLPM